MGLTVKHAGIAGVVRRMALTKLIALGGLFAHDPYGGKRPRPPADRPLPQVIDFNTATSDPSSSENCYACHGPDKNKRKADLRLDIKGRAFSPFTTTGPTSFPRSPDQSELFRRITATDPAERMPDPKSNKKGSPNGRSLSSRSGSSRGAPWKGHWGLPAAPPRVRGPPAIDDPSFCKWPHRSIRPSRD